MAGGNYDQIKCIYYLYYSSIIKSSIRECYFQAASKPTVKMSCIRVDNIVNMIEWTDTFSLQALERGNTKRITFPIPESSDLLLDSDGADLERDSEAGTGSFITSQTGAESSIVIKFVIRGANNRFNDGAFKRLVKENGEETDGNVTVGPELRIDPSLFRLVVGGGIKFLLADQADFKIENNYLLITNDSSKRSSLLFGGLFFVRPLINKFKSPYAFYETDPLWKDILTGCAKGFEILALPVWVITDDIMLSFEFTDQSTSDPDGIAAGLSKRLNSHLSIVAGFSTFKGTELSPGFRHGANLIIKNYVPDDDTVHPVYSRFISFDIGDDDNKLDGFPLFDAGTRGSEPIFPGHPIIDSKTGQFISDS